MSLRKALRLAPATGCQGPNLGVRLTRLLERGIPFWPWVCLGVATYPALNRYATKLHNFKVLKICTMGKFDLHQPSCGFPELTKRTVHRVSYRVNYSEAMVLLWPIQWKHSRRQKWPSPGCTDVSPTTLTARKQPPRILIFR